VFVAGFIGSPAMNLLPGRVTEGGVAIGGATIPTQRGLSPAGPQVTAGFRPESLVAAAPGDGFAVTVDVVEELGSDAYVYGRLAGSGSDAIVDEPDVIARVDPRQAPAKGDTVHFKVRDGELHLFDSESGARLG
jgi:multiple sugar transport system ATP-binding protein